jgi:ankyrin repeat protein
MAAPETLYDAASRGDLLVVQAFIASGEDVNKTYNGASPLFIASENGHLEVVKALIAAYADINKTMTDGAWPLYAASRNGRLEVVKVLLAAGADVNKAINNGASPIYIASAKGHLEVVKALIAAHADVNKTKNDGLSPLYVASQNGHNEVVKTLIAVGADINKAMNDGVSPLHVASHNGHLEVVKALIAGGADVNKETNVGVSPLGIASHNGHLEIVKTLIAVGADVNKVMNDGSSPLFTASQNGHLEIIRALIAAGADVNKTNEYEVSPLTTASQNGHLEVVKALIAVGADVNKAMNNGSSPLLIASYKGHLEVAKALIAAHADVNKTNKDGISPLLVASHNGHLEIVKALIAVGADVNKVMNKGSSPLFIASEKGHIEIVKALLAAKADVNIYDVLQKAEAAKFKPEINKLIINSVPGEMWSGFTRNDIAKFNDLFNTEVHEGGRSTAENISVCPVCLAYTVRSDGCKYMRHNCILDVGMPHKKLYDMYKSPTGVISWCTVCGRVCDSHHHYNLSHHSQKATRAPELTGLVDYYSSDCVREGGGGLMEKLARFRRMREYALELNEQVGKISKKEAIMELVEETWDAPLTRRDKKRLERIAANKKWNIPTENFLPNAKPTAENMSIVYPNIDRPNANKALVPTASRALNAFDEEQTLIQFHHRMANGKINNHEDNLISQPTLQGFIEDINKNFGIPAFGLCWDYRDGSGCSARLYPEEIKDFVTPEVYETYRKHFNKKFAAPVAAAGAGAVGGRRKTYKLKRKQKGGAEDMLKEATLAECVLPPRKGGYRKRTRKLARRGRK